MKSWIKAPAAPTRTLTRGNDQVPQNGFWRSPSASVWNESAEIRDFFYQTPNAGFCSLRTDNKRLKHIREAFIAFSRLVYDCYLFSKGYCQTQTKLHQTLNEINKILGVYPWSSCGSVEVSQARRASGAVVTWQPPKLRPALWECAEILEKILSVDVGGWRSVYRSGSSKNSRASFYKQSAPFR